MREVGRERSASRGEISEIESTEEIVQPRVSKEHWKAFHVHRRLGGEDVRVESILSEVMSSRRERTRSRCCSGEELVSGIRINSTSWSTQYELSIPALERDSLAGRSESEREGKEMARGEEKERESCAPRQTARSEVASRESPVSRQQLGFTASLNQL